MGEERWEVGLMSHNFENLLRWPVMIGCPLREIIADEAVNVAVHPLSQSWPTERRDPEAREGKI